MRSVVASTERPRLATPVVRGRPKKNQTLKQMMARKLATQCGEASYARRKVIAEPPFGQIKQARGFSQFLLRGLNKVRAQWSLIALTHNLLKLFRFGFPLPNPKRALA